MNNLYEEQILISILFFLFREIWELLEKEEILAQRENRYKLCKVDQFLRLLIVILG